MRIAVQESLRLRITTEGLWKTLIRPALVRAVCWAIGLIVLERITSSRHEYSSQLTFVLLIFSLVVGGLTTLARAMWARELRFYDSGNVVVLGPRKMLIAEANIADMEPVEMVDDFATNTVVLCFQFPHRNGTKTITFTTQATKEKKTRLRELLSVP